MSPYIHTYHNIKKVYVASSSSNRKSFALTSHQNKKDHVVLVPDKNAAIVLFGTQSNKLVENKKVEQEKNRVRRIMAMTTMKFLHGEGKQPQRTRSWSSRRRSTTTSKNTKSLSSPLSSEQPMRRSRCRSLSSNAEELFFSTARMASFIRSNTYYSNSSNSSICSSIDADDDKDEDNKNSTKNNKDSSTFPDVPKVDATSSSTIGRRASASASSSSMLLSNDDRINSLRTMNEARTKALLSCSNEQVEVCRAIRRELPPFL